MLKGLLRLAFLLSLVSHSLNNPGIFNNLGKILKLSQHYHLETTGQLLR